MPDRRRHRGPHPEDDELFAEEAWPVLRAGVHDLSWLSSRGYVDPSATKLVGDRHGLRERQRLAVRRSACSDQALADRRGREVPPAEVAGRALLVDGYNVLITVEAALAGGVLLLGRDGCLRDLASIHGHFRRVAETLPALGLLGEEVAALLPRETVWFLDQPVSNSGRLAATMRDLAASRGWAWHVRLVPSPDGAILREDGVAATADSVVLDRCGGWLNLARHVVTRRLPTARPIVLAPEAFAAGRAAGCSTGHSGGGLNEGPGLSGRPDKMGPWSVAPT